MKRLGGKYEINRGIKRKKIRNIKVKEKRKNLK